MYLPYLGLGETAVHDLLAAPFSILAISVSPALLTDISNERQLHRATPSPATAIHQSSRPFEGVACNNSLEAPAAARLHNHGPVTLRRATSPAVAGGAHPTTCTRSHPWIVALVRC